MAHSTTGTPSTRVRPTTACPGTSAHLRPGAADVQAAPGTASNELVPDLAEGLGTTDDGGKTWTYKIRKGVKYEDGTEVKAKDVKYAVLRSIDKETFPNGPAYFEGYLNLPAGYKGPHVQAA